MMRERHTVEQYREIQKAYDYFNRRLWRGTLPQILVTLQRKPRMMGYFAPERYQHRVEANVIHEIALNPDCFVRQTDEQVLDTLVHEMSHVWQQTFGKPGRRGYHNKQWAAEMKRIGLYPSNTGKPGGKELGRRMSDYIVEEGAFQKACRRLLASGFRLDWQSHPRSAGGRRPGEQGGGGHQPKKDRMKYTCPRCALNAWAKPGAMLLCGDCSHTGKGHRLVAMHPV